MKPELQPNHNRASIMLYCSVALNAKSKSGHTINKIKAAQALSDLLQIDRRAPISWLRGDFSKHPFSRENFLKFVREYQNKPGLESDSKVTGLAVDLYGSDYQRALELLDPMDWKIIPENEDCRGKKDLEWAIFDLINSSSPEEVKGALMHLMRQRLNLDASLDQK